MTFGSTPSGICSKSDEIKHAFSISGHFLCNENYVDQVTDGDRPVDMTQIVTDSVDSQKPIIIVSVQYRLNIFAFGGGDGNINMALRDQALALDWVQEHIAGFGGDPVGTDYLYD